MPPLLAVLVYIGPVVLTNDTLSVLVSLTNTDPLAA